MVLKYTVQLSSFINSNCTHCTMYILMVFHLYLKKKKISETVPKACIDRVKENWKGEVEEKEGIGVERFHFF